MLLLAPALAAPAVPVAGLEWRPLGRTDLDWVQDQRTSGLGVGEFDGAVRPALSAWFGLRVSERTALVGSLGVARRTTTVWADGPDGEPVYRSRHWGVVRPELGLRVAPWTFGPGPRAFVQVTLFGDVPSARDVSNAYTEEEQDNADATAAAERVRLGGLGARAGFGVDVPVGRGIHVGGMYALIAQQTLLVSDDADAVSTWLAAEASLLLSVAFPAKGAASEP